MSWKLKVIGLAGLLILAGCAAPASKTDGERTTLTPAAAEVVKEEGRVEASTEENQKDSRVVCERHKKTGSHMTQTYCYTVAEQDKVRDKAQDDVRRAQQGGPRADQRVAPRSGPQN